MKSLSSTPPAETLVSRRGKQRSVRKIHDRSRKNALSFWSFVLPLLLGITVFFYIPIIWAIVLSFSTARATITPTGFVGIQNYISMLNDSEFTGALGTFSIFAIFIVPTTFLCSLGLALLVNSIKVGQGFFRSVFFLPTACSYVLASIIWKMFSGFTTFLFRQFFLSFPHELEEAGRVDGLGTWGIFLRIVVPNSYGIIAALSVITFIASWNAFLWPLVIGQDQSAWTVQVVLSQFLNAQVLNLHELFMGSAIAILPLVIIFFVL